jgi:carbonic anhydrase
MLAGFAGKRIMMGLKKTNKSSLYMSVSKLMCSSPPTLFDVVTSKDEKCEEPEIKMGVCRHDSCVSKDSYKQTYKRLLKGNKEYVKEKLEGNPNYFSDMAKTQTPKYLLIGCSDSRVPPNEMTKTDPGEIFIHRNIANQVIFSDLNCMSVLQYAVEHLKVEHIIVMGHTKCGGVIASNNKNFKGLIESWLQNIKDIAIMNKSELDTCKSEHEFITKLTELNVKTQALNVCKTPFVQKAWAEGRDLHVHGWLLDIETGLIKDLGITNRDWNEIKSIYNFNFH